MGSIYNEAMRDSTSQRWQGSQQCCTLQRDVDHHWQYVLHGHSLQHAGCVAKPLVRMKREHILMCVLHFIMALGQLVVQLLEALCKNLDNVLRAVVQFVLGGERTRVRLGSATSRDGVEVYRLPQS